MKHILVFSTVLITVLSSLLLDYTADQNDKTNWIVLIIIGVVFLLNLLKFGVWGWIHKKFEVSKSYPLTSIFFPLIFVVAYIKGEAEITASKVFGVTLIMIGLLVFEKQKSSV